MSLTNADRQLPEGWTERKFGEIALLNRGHNPPKSKFINQPKEGYVRFYQIRDGKSDDYEVYVPDTPQLHKVKPDEILMVAYRHIGRVFRGANGAFNVALCKIANKDRSVIDDDYLFYIIPTEFVRGELMKQAERSLIPSMSVKHLAEIKIPVPPLSEQKRIVSIVDQAFEGIDRAIANTEKNLTNARELFESYLNAIFTRKSNGWKEKTLREVSLEFGRGKSKHRPRNDPKLYGGSYPFIQTGDVRNCNHVITECSQFYSEAGLAQSKLWPKGTICITIAANIAETGILGFDACFPDSVIGIVVNDEITSNDFVEYLLQAVKTRIKAKGKGSAQDNINLGTFENEKFPFPSLEQQNVIVDNLNQLSSETQRLEAIYRQKLAALNELKQSVLQKAFTGELTSNTPQQATETAKEVVAA